MTLHLRPTTNEYSSWYHNYVQRVMSSDVLSALEDSRHSIELMWPEISQLPASYAYESGKWCIAQLLRHIIDSEWVFAYRALRFARKDTTELPGYDHDAYAMQIVEDSLPELYNQFIQVRSATTGLFRSFPESAGLLCGTANGNLCSVRALGFIIAGHQLHHLDILSSRYLSGFERNV